MLWFDDGQAFATGRTAYEYRPVSQEETNRLLLQVEINDLPLLAVVDTGSPYVIVQPTYTDVLELDPSEALEEKRILIRGTTCNGLIYRLPLLIPASDGESLGLEVTAFIPQVDEEIWGDLPSFLGMMGCLERLRFAVDPNEDAFYFGSLS